MNKKHYLEPRTEIENVKPELIIATSTGATIPDAGWGESKERISDAYNEEEF